MVKNKHTLPAIAVFLLLSAAAVYAQSESPTKKASAGGFLTDVDRFVSTTDWADIPLKSWFSYINLSADRNISNEYNKSWEIGLAKKLGNFYLGVGYQGRFWTGKTGWGEITQDLESGDLIGPTADVSALFTEQPNPSAISWPSGGNGTQPNHADNVFSFLVGLGNGQAVKLKITEKDAFTRTEGPVLVQGTPDNAEKVKGWYRQLYGTVTPSLEYGFSQAIEAGAFSIRPKAALDLEIKFNEKDLSWDNETRYVEFVQNSMSPMITLDSGAADIWQWDGGALGIGITEKLKYTYQDTTAKDKTGTVIPGSIGQDAEATQWKNALTPYIRFTQVIDPSLTVKAALDAPISLESNPDQDVNGGTFGFYDATAASAYRSEFSASNPKNDEAFPKLRLGVQYAFKSGKLADKLLLNAGVTVYLPALLYTDATTTIDPETGMVTTVASASAWEWKIHQGSGGEKLQELSLGTTFKFGEHAALDFWTKIALEHNSPTLIENQFWDTLFQWGGILFHLTY